MACRQRRIKRLSVHGFSIERGDHVSAVEPVFFRRAAGNDVGDQRVTCGIGVERRSEPRGRRRVLLQTDARVGEIAFIGRQILARNVVAKKLDMSVPAISEAARTASPGSNPGLGSA